MESLFKQNGASLFFATCMTIFLLCTYSGNDQNQFIDFPHFTIGVLPINIVLLVSVLFAVMLLVVKNTMADALALMLFSRLILHCIPIVYMGVPSRFSLNMTVSVICLVTYLISLNFCENERLQIKTFNVFYLFLCAQIIVEAFMGSESYFGNVYFYKHDMALPIGSSNALASKIVPMFAFLFVIARETWVKTVYTIIALFVVALTKSRGGLIDLIMIIGVVSIWRGFFSLKLIFSFLLMVVFLLFMSNYFLNYTELGGFVFSDSDSTVVGRFDLWREGLRVFGDHPFFGNGFYYFDVAMHPHNWIIDVLMRSGLMGMSLAVGVVVYLFFYVKDFFEDSLVRGCFVALLCLLWQGLVEIVLFSHIHDIMMWSIVGLMVARVNHLKQEFVVKT